MKSGTTIDVPNGTASKIAAGIVAGIIAGIIMAIFAMIVSAAKGQGFWTPVYLISGLYWGVNALVMGPAVAVIGVITHLVVASIYGVIFAFSVQKKTSAGSAFFGGLVYGILIWAFMTYLIDPWADPTLDARTNLTSGWWLLFHLAFGATLCLTPALMQALLKKETTIPEPQQHDQRAA